MITRFNTDIEYHQKQVDEPNDVGGLTPEQFKKLCDQGAIDIKDYLVDVLAPEIETQFSTKEEIGVIILGQIPDGTITKTKLSLDLNNELDGLSTDKVDKNDYVANNAYAVTSGTLTAYVATLNPAPTTYVDGMTITIVPHVNCGASPTLNINSLGALTLVKSDGTAFIAGELKANKPYSFVRVGSNFFLRSGGGSNIKSIQTGSTSIAGSLTKNVTISNIDISKSIILVEVSALTLYPYISFVTAEIIDSTTIKLTRGLSQSDPIVVKWTVIEFNNVKSKQTGSVTVPAADTTTNVSISSVDTSKSLAFLSVRLTASNSDTANYFVYSNLLASTLQIKRVAAAQADCTVCWQVIEFS